MSMAFLAESDQVANRRKKYCEDLYSNDDNSAISNGLSEE